MEPLPWRPELWVQNPEVSSVRVPEFKLRSAAAFIVLGPITKVPGCPAEPSPLAKPPSRRMVPFSISPSEIRAILPPPPAPPALVRNRAPGSRSSIPEACPPFTSRIPSFEILEPTIRIEPPEPAPPEKLAPTEGLTRMEPPFIEIWTPSEIRTWPDAMSSMAPPPAAASPKFPNPPPEPPINIPSPP